MRSALLALPFLAACARPPLDGSTRDPRALHAAAGEIAMHATWYPPTSRPHPRPNPVVVLEPELFTRELLTRSGGLVPWLESEGFGVWLVGADAGVPPSSRALGAGVVAMIEALEREARLDRVDLIAPSLSAPAAMFALDALIPPLGPSRVGRVVFLGGGLDYALGPSTFAARIAPMRGGAATAMCTLDDGAYCARAFRSAGARAWLGALPPADADELAPARERFPFLTRFGDHPVLFVAGKADGLGPSESVYPAYVLWGRDAPDPRKVPKRFFLAGRENGFHADDDAFALLGGERAPDEIWPHVADWLLE